MASTLTALIADPISYSICNTGDSRAYHYQAADHSFHQITVDQTVAQNMFNQGRITKEQVKSHPDRNVLASAIGIEGADAPMIPDLYNFDWEKGDHLLLCSDGLTDMIGDAMILQVMTNTRSVEKKYNQLLTLSLGAGGHDNITVILLENAS
jgi:protein phosphatase